jgi:3-oxoacyl-[acyl-carrier-protein] synthase II
LVLELLENALKRNAKIYGEIKSFGTYGDSFHLTKPMDNGEGGYRTMMKCLYDAKMTPNEIDMINCHATSTEVGDKAELIALKNLFGNKELFNYNKLKYKFEEFEFEEVNENDKNFCKENLKRIIMTANKTYIGHLLGAAGAVETLFGILSMNDNYVIPNKNTVNPLSNLFDFNRSSYISNNNNDKKNYISNIFKGEIKNFIKNSFAFGGINSSILISKYN